MKSLIFFALTAVCTLLASVAHADDKDLVWFPLKTTEGCIYYKFAFPENVAGSRADTRSVEWSGPRCAPGAPIEGAGTVKVTMFENGMLWWSQASGTFKGGVPDGTIMSSSSFRSKPKPIVFREGCSLMPDGSWHCPTVPPPSLAAGRRASSRTTPSSQAGGGGILVPVDNRNYSNCIALGPARVKGGNIQLVNSCSVKLNVNWCVYRPTGIDGGNFDCEKTRGGLSGIPANGSTYTYRGEMVYWLACAHSAYPRDIKYETGRGMTGRCQ